MGFEWRGKCVLVTGGAGFLGSTLCHALSTHGAEVRALDAMLPGTGAHPANLAGSGATLIQADLRHADLAPTCAGVDVLFNMAAQTSHMGSQQEPEVDLAINATAQLRLIAALRAEAPQARVVHVSTRQFYGPPRYLPVDEAHPIASPDNNGVSKYAGEQYWLLEGRLNARPVTALRLTNCYGPRLRIKDHRQTFLGIWIRRLLEGDAFEVWGGQQLRDLAYADDVAAACMAAAVTPGCAGHAFNLGGAPPVTLLDLAEMLVAANGGGRYITREFPADRAAIDIGSFHATDAAFRAATGWEPQVSLETGLRRTLDWYRPRLAQYIGDVLP